MKTSCALLLATLLLIVGVLIFGAYLLIEWLIPSIEAIFP